VFRRKRSKSLLGEGRKSERKEERSLFRQRTTNLVSSSKSSPSGYEKGKRVSLGRGSGGKKKTKGKTPEEGKSAERLNSRKNRLLKCKRGRELGAQPMRRRVANKTERRACRRESLPEV